MFCNNGGLMRIARVIEDFVADIGWKDHVEHLEDEALSRLAVRLSVENRSYRLMLEGYEDRGWLVLCLYAPFTARTDMFADLSLLFNYMNGMFSYPGHVSVDDDGVVCYRQIADLDDREVGISFVHNMLRAAVDMFERNAPGIEAVAEGTLRYEDVRREIEKLCRQ